MHSCPNLDLWGYFLRITIDDNDLKVTRLYYGQPGVRGLHASLKPTQIETPLLSAMVGCGEYVV